MVLCPHVLFPIRRSRVLFIFAFKIMLYPAVRRVLTCFEWLLVHRKIYFCFSMDKSATGIQAHLILVHMYMNWNFAWYWIQRVQPHVIATLLTALSFRYDLHGSPSAIISWFMTTTDHSTLAAKQLLSLPLHISGFVFSLSPGVFHSLQFRFPTAHVVAAKKEHSCTMHVWVNHVTLLERYYR